MDNRQFCVNGENKKDLLVALELAFKIRYEKTKAAAYVIDRKKGFVLLWSDHKDSVRFPVKLAPKSIVDMIWEWLKQQYKDGFTPDDNWDKASKDLCVDSHPGWKVYCEEWGHVKLSSTEAGTYAIVAVKPVWLQFGK